MMTHLPLIYNHHIMFSLSSVTCFERIVRVAGATFTETGVQSFLSLPSTAASSASLIISIPEKHTSKAIDTIANHSRGQQT